jgi:hypothetical protein
MANHDQSKPPDEENRSREKGEGAATSNIVEWKRGDVGNPWNWSLGFKIWIAFQLGMLALCRSLGSSIIAPAEEVIAKYVGVSSEVTVLVTSLYM